MTINNGYLSIPFSVDRDTLIQQALQNITTSIPGWQPRDGNLEVLLLEQFAEMSAEAAQVAAQVPLSIFSYYGSLVGLAQNPGTSAVVTTTWTLTQASSTDTTFPAGTPATIQANGTNFSFTLDESFTITAGSTYYQNVTMTAASAGSSYNNAYTLGITNYLTPTWSYSNLSSIVINELSVQGTDPETNDTYLNRLSNTLSTYTPRPITVNDYATLAQQVYGINRVTALNNTNSFINLLSNSQIIPNTAGFVTTRSTDSSGLTNGTTFSGVSFTPATTGASFAVAAVAAATGTQGFIPFQSGTTSAPVTGTSLPLTSLTLATGSWPSSGGYGFLVNNGALAGFAYTGVSGSTLTGCSWLNGIAPTGAAVGSSVGYAGTSNWWGTTTPPGSGSEGLLGYGTVVAIGSGEAAVIEGVGVSTSGNAGFLTTAIQNSYASGTLLSIAPGITSNAATVSSNGVNMVGKVTIKSTSTDTNVFPVLTATVKYQNISGYYTYFSDPSARDDYQLNQSLTVLIPGTSPVAYSGSLSDPTITADILYTNVASVSLNIYWANAQAAVAKSVLFASLYQSNDNFAYPLNGQWYENFSPSGNPGSVLPDGLFNSAYEYAPPSTNYAGGSGTIATRVMTDGGIILANTNNWPSSGVGNFIDTLGNTHYFFWTSISGNLLYALTTNISNYGSGSINSNTIFNCMTYQNTPNMWAMSMPSGAGQITALPNVGVQFTPNNTSTTAAATATSEVFSLIANTEYVVDYTVDLTNITTAGGQVPSLELTTTSGAVLASYVPPSGAVGGVYRSTGTYTPTSNTDVNCVIVFPTSLSLSGSTIVKNIQIVPVVGNLYNATNGTVSPNYAFQIDSYGPINPGPLWLAPGPGPYVTVGGQSVAGYPRNVTVIAATSDGLNPGLNEIQNTQNYLQSYREINFNVNVIAPDYALIDVAYTVVSARGYDLATVQNSILNNLTKLISPYNWASNAAGSETWDSSQTTLHYLDVVGLIDEAPGVANILSVTTCLHGGTPGTSDITFASAMPSPGIGVLPILASVTANIQPSNATIFESAGQLNF